ncbi:unnamed protein product [Rangifer tarandus platyrhynchus]|uniref:Uncharacterized protein n=2 Tax=Rangifer tarandus platyrhynchus TaxID=3082113 RepID=A0ACB0F3C4_RANTA|nr:unnamed protein product [Rangifer tarandus platyrhynchus]CAI9707344.1 unnamed protein product [Rangifer tarandus platyrhynchus]
MKTVRFVSFLIFFSYIRCQTLQRSLLDAATQQTNGQNFLEENLRAITSIMVAQFLQKLTYEKVQIIVQELLDLAEKCKTLKSHELPSESCHQLMATFLEHIWSNQGMAGKCVFSDCCNINKTARHKCFLLHKKDDTGYTEIFQISNPEQICEMGKENKVPVKDRYIYETSRKHPFLYGPTILTMSVCYETAVQSCCREENKTECFQTKEGMFQRVVRESHECVKNQCDVREKLGDSNFHDRLIVFYTKKAPQLSAQELIVLTKNMAAAASKCCPLDQEPQFVCMEDSAKLILGALCRRHETEPISAAVGECCDDSDAFRKHCFDDLQVDGTYISPPLSCDQVINLKEDLCKAQEEELKTEKLKLLSNLVKQKPYAAEMQFQSIIVDFAHLVEMCCQAEKSEMCFQEEGFKLIEKCQLLLGS